MISCDREIARIRLSLLSLSYIKPEGQESLQGKGSHSTKFEQKLQQIFRELCDSKLSGSLLFNNMAIIHWDKNRSKIER